MGVQDSLAENDGSDPDAPDTLKARIYKLSKMVAEVTKERDDLRDTRNGGAYGMPNGMMPGEPPATWGLGFCFLEVLDSLSCAWTHRPVLECIVLCLDSLT